jgi:hypothetical protein
MQITKDLLNKLGYLHLVSYNGKPVDLDQIEDVIHQALIKQPLNVRAVHGVECDPALLNVVQEVEKKGEYSKFFDMKEDIVTGLNGITSPVPFHHRLSVLPNGIFIGEPYDIIAQISNQEERIRFPEKGLGFRLGEVVFKDVTII